MPWPPSWRPPHDGLTALGADPDAGTTWVLCIAAVVVVVRTLVLPIAVHGVRLAHANARALPHLAPERTLRFVALPAGQDPDDLIKAGGRAAMDAVLAAPEPLVGRLWRHERDSSPLSTPEERAGLKQRLMAHAAAIGDQHNDLPMLARAGLAIAMGNAPEDVKQAAAHVTDANDADGVAHAIDRYILNRGTQ